MKPLHGSLLMRTLAAAVLATARVLLLAAGLAAPAFAACGPYRVAYYEFGSFYFREDDGQYRGIDKDVIEEVVRRTGCQLNGFLDSRVRTWASLQDGTLDMSVSGIVTPEREKFARFAVYIVSRNHLLIKSSEARRISSLADFEADPALRLGVVKSFRHGQTIDAWIDRLRQAGRVDDYADAEVVARVFTGDRVQAFFSEPLAVTPLLKRNGLEGKVTMLDVVPRENYRAGLVMAKSRMSEEVAGRLDDAINDMIRDGTMEAIYRRYMPAATARKVVPAPR